MEEEAGLEEIPEKQTKYGKIGIVTIISVILIMAGLWFLFIKENELDDEGDIEFTISMDKYVFDENESLSVTFGIHNNKTDEVIISEMQLDETLFLYLSDSEGEILMAKSPTFPYDNITIEPGLGYFMVTNINNCFHRHKDDWDYPFEFTPDTYNLYATYKNLNDDEATYTSNTITFIVE